ncbi:MAG: hypothetical protein GY943_11675, partial [Chloroflexi bacterium]|nr:hypothetical protein [Chloroflexota bacterium]
ALEAETTVDQSIPTAEKTAEASADALFDGDISDMPDDPDAALAWLQQLSDDQVDTVPDAPTTVVIEAETAVDEPTSAAQTPAADEVVEPSADDLFADIFAMPDDQDAAMAWLEDDDADVVVEDMETAVDEPTPDEPTSAEQVPAAEEVAEPSADDLFADIFAMPDDQDAAMAWLEDDDADVVVEDVETAVDEPTLDEPTATEQAPVAEEVAEPSADDLFADIFAMPDDQDAAMAWLDEDVDDVLPPTEEPATPVLAELAEEPTEQPPEVDLPDDLADSFLSDVPEDQDEAMAWVEKMAARQSAALDELPTVDAVDENIEMPDWAADQAAQDEEEFVAPDPEPATSEEEPTSEFRIEDDFVDAALFETVDDEFDHNLFDGDEPGQTDWLTDMPEPDVLGWLEAEAEVSGDSQVVETGPLPDTGPLFDETIPDTGELDTVIIPQDDIIEDEDDFFLEEEDTSSFMIDVEQVDAARSSLDSGNIEDAVGTYQQLVSRGDGLMMLIGELESVTDEFPQQQSIRRLLGDAYMRNGQLQKALNTYREALDQL